MNNQIALINGPNLNTLGKRPESIYGTESFEQLIDRVQKECDKLGLSLNSFQSNSEGEIIDHIQQVISKSAAIIINPGAYSHTSIAIRDALEPAKIPIIEVHISNIFKREEFRKHSFISEVSDSVVCGFGTDGYLIALNSISQKLKRT